MNQRLQYDLVQKEIKNEVFKIPVYSTGLEVFRKLNLFNKRKHIFSKKEKITHFYDFIIIAYGYYYNDKCELIFKEILKEKLNHIKIEIEKYNEFKYDNYIKNKHDIDFIHKCNIMYKYTNQMLDNLNKESKKYKCIVKSYGQIKQIEYDNLPAYSNEYDTTEKIGCFSILKNILKNKAKA